MLRGLDTVEDDMAIPDDVKIPLLHCFHEKCYDRKFTMVRVLVCAYALAQSFVRRLKPRVYVGWQKSKVACT